MSDIQNKVAPSLWMVDDRVVPIPGL